MTTFSFITAPFLWGLPRLRWFHGLPLPRFSSHTCRLHPSYGYHPYYGWVTRVYYPRLDARTPRAALRLRVACSQHLCGCCCIVTLLRFEHCRCPSWLRFAHLHRAQFTVTRWFAYVYVYTVPPHTHVYRCRNRYPHLLPTPHQLLHCPAPLQVTRIYIAVYPVDGSARLYAFCLPLPTQLFPLHLRFPVTAATLPVCYALVVRSPRPRLRRRICPHDARVPGSPPLPHCVTLLPRTPPHTHSTRTPGPYPHPPHLYLPSTTRLRLVLNTCQFGHVPTFYIWFGRTLLDGITVITAVLLRCRCLFPHCRTHRPHRFPRCRTCCVPSTAADYAFPQPHRCHSLTPPFHTYTLPATGSYRPHTHTPLPYPL